MSRRLRTLVIVPLLFATGCIPMSLCPLYSPDVLVLDSRIEGTWGQQDESDRWIITRADDESYTIQVDVEESGDDLVYQAHLMKLGRYYFLDLYIDNYPGYPDLADSLLEFQLVPAHTFFRVDFTDAGFSLRSLDAEWLEDRAEKNRLWVDHTPIEAWDGFPIFTASTKRMQRFLKKWASHDDVWGDAITLSKMN